MKAAQRERTGKLFTLASKHFQVQLVERTTTTVIPQENGIQRTSHCFACLSCSFKVADPQEVTARKSSMALMKLQEYAPQHVWCRKGRRQYSCPLSQPPEFKTVLGPPNICCGSSSSIQRGCSFQKAMQRDYVQSKPGTAQKPIKWEKKNPMVFGLLDPH